MVSSAVKSAVSCAEALPGLRKSTKIRKTFPKNKGMLSAFALKAEHGFLKNVEYRL
jgi:hypothetical protein